MTQRKGGTSHLSFDVALQTLQGYDAKAMDSAVKPIQDLSKQPFPAVLYMVGLREISGDQVDKKPADGLVMIQKLAAEPAPGEEE